MGSIEKNCYHCEQIGPGVGKKSCGYMGDGKTALDCLHYTPNALVKAMNVITEVLKEPVEHTPARVNHEFSVEVTATERPPKNCCRCKSVQGGRCGVKRSHIGDGEQAATCKFYKYDVFRVDYRKLFQMHNDVYEAIKAAKAKQKEKENTMGLTKKNCDICQNVMGSQCGFNGSGIGNGEQATTCEDFVLLANKSMLDSLVEMLNRRISNVYIVITMLGGGKHYHIVNNNERHIISPKQAALRGLRHIAYTPRSELLEELNSKCELDDNLKNDLGLIHEVLNKSFIDSP